MVEQTKAALRIVRTGKGNVIPGVLTQDLIEWVEGRAVVQVSHLEEQGSHASHPSHKARAAAATALAFLSPLVWFNAGRPMSDTAGLVAAVAVQAATLTARSERGLCAAAALCGFATGIRAQVAWLTFPLLLLVTWRRAHGGGWAAGSRTASRVLLFGAEGHLVGMPTVGVRAVGSERGHFDVMPEAPYQHHPELRAHVTSAGEELVYPGRHGIRDDVVVLGGPVEDHVAHAAAGEQRAMAAGAQLRHDGHRRVPACFFATRHRVKKVTAFDP